MNSNSILYKVIIQNILFFCWKTYKKLNIYNINLTNCFGKVQYCSNYVDNVFGSIRAPVKSSSVGSPNEDWTLAVGNFSYKKIIRYWLCFFPLKVIISKDFNMGFLMWIYILLKEKKYMIIVYHEVCEQSGNLFR